MRPFLQQAEATGAGPLADAAAGAAAALARTRPRARADREQALPRGHRHLLIVRAGGGAQLGEMEKIYLIRAKVWRQFAFALALLTCIQISENVQKMW